MKRRRVIYDYVRQYFNGKFVGWKVAKIPPKPEINYPVAVFYGPKSKAHAQRFTKQLNQEILE